MAYLLVLNYDIVDHDKFAEYAKLSPGTVPANMKVLAFDREPQDLEGSSRRCLTIVEFPSKEEALSWYESEAYRSIRGLRLSSTEGFLRGAPKLPG